MIQTCLHVCICSKAGLDGKRKSGLLFFTWVVLYGDEEGRASSQRVEILHSRGAHWADNKLDSVASIGELLTRLFSMAIKPFAKKEAGRKVEWRLAYKYSGGWRQCK